MAKEKKCDLTDEKVLEQFIELCKLQCTSKEVASFFKISRETLRTRIKAAFGPDVTWEKCFEEFGSSGLISLRRKQFRLADKSAAMAIFLGKNYLDQVDVKTLDDVNKPITLVYKDAEKPNDSVTVKVDPNKTATDLEQ